MQSPQQQYYSGSAYTQRGSGSSYDNSLPPPPLPYYQYQPYGALTWDPASSELPPPPPSYYQHQSHGGLTWDPASSELPPPPPSFYQQQPYGGSTSVHVSTRIEPGGYGSYSSLVPQAASSHQSSYSYSSQPSYQPRPLSQDPLAAAATYGQTGSGFHSNMPPQARPSSQSRFHDPVREHGASDPPTRTRRPIRPTPTLSLRPVTTEQLRHRRHNTRQHMSEQLEEYRRAVPSLDERRANFEAVLDSLPDPDDYTSIARGNAMITDLDPNLEEVGDFMGDRDRQIWARALNRYRYNTGTGAAESTQAGSSSSKRGKTP